MKIMVTIAGLDEILPRNTGDIRSLFTLRNAGEESRTIKRCGRTS